MIDTKFLSSVNIFSALSATDIKMLETNFTVLNKNENDIIFKKGDPGSTMYIIQEGHIKITLNAMNGEELILTILHQGDFFGELTLFDESVRAANAIVYDHATLLEIPRSKFIRMIKSHPDIAVAMIGILGKRMRSTNDIMEKQITRNVNEVMEHKLSFGDRVADKCSEIIGSWAFIIWFGVLLWSWIGLNVFSLLEKPLDPYPFILLNLMLSCLAAIQAPVIMMSQGRQAKKDKLSADMDYKINLKAELQIQDIRANIDKINKLHMKLNKEIRHEQSEILKVQNRILEKLGENPSTPKPL